MAHHWINPLNSVQRLEMSFHVSSYWGWALVRYDWIDAVIKEVNRGLGVKGLLESVETWSGTTFFWEAEKERLLRLTDAPSTA